MGSEVFDSAVRATEAALRGLAESLPSGAVPPESLLIPLARVGDALRLGLDVPRPLRRWMDTIPQADLQGALAALIEETATWSLPESQGARAEEDPELAIVLRRRDEAESVRHALRRVCLPRGIDLCALQELGALETVLLVLDARIGALTSRASVARRLGVRAAMQPTWADGFAEDAEPDEDRAAPSDAPWPDSWRRILPSDDVVMRYVTRGALRRQVEGVAAANDDFARELALCIDGLREIRENVGIVALGWRKRARLAAGELAEGGLAGSPRRGSSGAVETDDPLLFSVIPTVQLAAATEVDHEPARNSVELGMLSPVDAYGRIEVTSRNVMVHVYPDRQPIAQIALGGIVATAPFEAGHWRVMAPLRADALRLSVLAVDGTEFVEELRFGPADTSHEAQ